MIKKIKIINCFERSEDNSKETRSYIKQRVSILIDVISNLVPTILIKHVYKATRSIVLISNGLPNLKGESNYHNYS